MQAETGRTPGSGPDIGHTEGTEWKEGKVMRRISSPGSIHKGKMLSAVFYVLALILLVTAVTALVACHKNISLQLEQGVPVAGNELAIVNLYLSSCVQYFALSAILIFLRICASESCCAKSWIYSRKHRLPCLTGQ